MLSRWWLSNSEKTKTLTPKNRLSARYEPAKLENIFDVWPQGVESKLVKLTSGRGNVIEFDIFSSLPFLSYNNKINKYEEIEVFEDMFAINILRVKLGPSATEVVSMIDNIDCKKRLKAWFYTRDHWFEREELFKILSRLEEIMGYLPEYEVADILCGYD